MPPATPPCSKLPGALGTTVRICVAAAHCLVARPLDRRYAGSAWFADAFALDLDENCVAQVNCDSPGRRWADVYEHDAG